MRFEVKTGGIIAILFGLTALSGGVFLMGLRAGYDIGHESQTDADKVATDYPLTVAPPASAAPAAQTPAASETSGLVEGPVPAAPREPAPSATGPALASIPKPSRVTAAPVPAAVPSPAAPSAEEPEASTNTGPPPAHNARKPFNIEIQAAMDATSANQMVKRLQALGYQPHVAPTKINGATWYKVEVGPYATQAEAATAEAGLRQKYNATYGHGGAPAQAADTDQSPEE